MEYVEGEPLTVYCLRHGCSIERRLQLFRQACEAVRFAHAHAVIHRDLKPSNILVTADGSVQLLDFGIAKQLDVIDAPGGQTRTVLRLMTPAYAAPEQVLGEQVGVHTDVYSLGVVLYELLASRLPFDLRDLSAIETRTVLLHHPAARPSQVFPATDSTASRLDRAQWADLDVLCLKAMQAEPVRRYSSVEAMLRDIDHYLASEPLEARPDNWTYLAAKFLRRNRPMATLAASAFVALVGVSAYFMLHLAHARDAALADAARIERVQQLMVNLFQGGDALAGPANDLKVIDMLDRGAGEVQAMSADPAVQAELLQSLAGIYQQLGQLAKADALYKLALAKREPLFGADSAPVAETLVAIGLLRIDQARPQEAEAMIRRGHAMAERKLAPAHPQALAARLALGRAQRERGAHDEAIATLLQAVALQSSPDVQAAERAAALSELASAHYAAGHYEDSGTLFEQALALHREALGSTHPLVARDLGNLAAIQQDLGYYAQAERLSRDALSITEGYYGPDSPRTADDLTSLGRALTYQEKYEEAVSVLGRAMTIQEAARGNVHPVVAEALNELGNVLAMQRRYGEAESHFRRTADIYRSVYGERSYLVAIALANVAYMQMQQSDYVQAEALFREVITLFSTTLSPDNVNTGIARIKLGRTLLRAGRYPEAEKESLAGYDILSRQASPSISFLQAARQDLSTAYDAMRMPERAQHYRSEMLALETSGRRVSP